jgi:hypothetical protein
MGLNGLSTQTKKKGLSYDLCTFATAAAFPSPLNCCAPAKANSVGDTRRAAAWQINFMNLKAWLDALQADERVYPDPKSKDA